ncbi:hypothetical protein BPSOL_1200 [Bifidobacterium pseudolongum]|nr:hypothetical protein BPSOL_1200 [Bifidobacterium pseudolongum]
MGCDVRHAALLSVPCTCCRFHYRAHRGCRNAHRDICHHCFTKLVMAGTVSARARLEQWWT